MLKISSKLSSLMMKETHKHCIEQWARHARFLFSRGELFVFVSMFQCFVSGSYWPGQTSLHYSKDPMECEAGLFLPVSQESRYHLWELFFSFRIPCTVSLFILSSVISCTNLTSEHAQEHTLFKLCFGRPISCTIVHIFSPLLEQRGPFKNIRLLHSVFTISHF